MIKDITIGQYFPIKSLIHELDPRVKLIGTFIFMASLFMIEEFFTYIFVIIFLAGVIRLSNIPSNYIIKGIKPLLYLLIFTFFINLLMTPGKVIYSLGFLNITNEGFKQGIFMTMRLVLLVIGTSILTLATSPIELTDGIEKLLNPYKKIGLPAHELAMMMTIALRFIPTLLDETDKIMKAQMARGADFESKNLLSRAKNLVPLLVPLFISAFRRADELAMAMEARCYRGGENRTRMKILKMKSKDYYATTVLFLYMLLIIVMKCI